MKTLIPLLFATALLLTPQPPAGQTGIGQGQLRVSVSNPPVQVVTSVTASTTNSFPIPSGKTTCIVTRNIAQSPSVDYSVVSGAVVFFQTPAVGDIVQLNCW